MKAHLIWATGRVVKVADGLTDISGVSGRRTRRSCQQGALLWAWDADPEFDEPAGEQWLILLPKKWNPQTQGQVYSWRYDPRELGAAQGPVRDVRRRNMRACTDDGEK